MSFIIHIFGAQKVNFLRLGKNLQILHEQVFSYRHNYLKQQNYQKK